MSSASPGSVGWRSRSASGPPPAQSLRTSLSKIRSLLSCSMRAVCRGSSLSSSQEIRPKQTRRGTREVLCRPSSTNHGQSSFFQNSAACVPELIRLWPPCTFSEGRCSTRESHVPVPLQFDGGISSPTSHFSLPSPVRVCVSKQ